MLSETELIAESLGIILGWTITLWCGPCLVAGLGRRTKARFSSAGKNLEGP